MSLSSPPAFGLWLTTNSDDPNTVDLPLLEMKPSSSASWSLPGFPKRYRTQLERSSSWKQRSLTILRYLVLTLLATVGIASLVMRLVKHIHGPESGYQMCYCGSSTQEAIEKGCKFDLLGPSWAPDHCRDDALTAEFLKAGPGPNGTWEFWWDHEHTMPMSIEEVSLLPGQYSSRPVSI